MAATFHGFIINDAMLEEKKQIPGVSRLLLLSIQDPASYTATYWTGI